MSKILIVDDTPENFDILNSILSDYETRSCLSGKHALERLELERIQPDMVIIDYHMDTGMMGDVLCQKIRQIPLFKDIPIIFLTTKNSNSDIVKMYESGGDVILEKPMSTDIIKAAVARHLQRNQEC